MMMSVLRWLTGFVTVLGLALPALAEPRIALVVGNGGYASVARLDNPVSDAQLMARALEAKGFTVTLISDADQVTLNRGIAQFGRDLRDAGSDATGLFFYAGHGVQSFGTNYLLPVDTHLTDAADLSLVGVLAESVLRQMASARNKTNIVILDACRNNPFEAIPDMDDNGLAEMKAPTGTFLAYSTAPGAVALDGLDANSPFTKALASRLDTPGEPIEQVFKQVRIAVLEETNGMQTPWDTSSLTGEFYFTPAASGFGAGLPEEVWWGELKTGRDPVQIMLFMRAYPDSTHIEAARALLAETMSGELQSLRREATDEVEETAAAEPIDEAPPPPDQMTFETPLSGGLAETEGKSIADLILGTPVHAPFEGLPDELWKGKTCVECHSWTREALCTQGGVYLAQNASRALAPVHPYGGTLRRALQDWAASGCN